MGTGIVSSLLHNLPYNGKWLYWLSIVIFCLNVALFIIFFAISTLRYTLYPAIWKAMIRHPAQSMFVGTFPIAFSTIINMVVFVCVPAWGYKAIQLVSESQTRRNGFRTKHSRLGLYGGSTR
jgi:tellurite resistance protein TehA-like permease